MYLRCRKVGVEFGGQPTAVEALRGLTLDVRAGEFLSVVGPSGCGKTTLLRVLAGLLKPTAGTVEWQDDSSARRVSMIRQDGGLFPWLTVLDNAAFALEAQGVGRDERRRQARSWLERFGLGGRERAYPHQISAGMRQRVALARGFLSRPQLLLMDEPFGALDALTRMQLQRELLSLWEEQRVTVVFVTHDVDEAIMLSDRVVALSQHPGAVLSEHKVFLERPRSIDMEFSEPFLALRLKLLEQLGVALPGVLDRVIQQ